MTRANNVTIYVYVHTIGQFHGAWLWRRGVVRRASKSDRLSAASRLNTPQIGCRYVHMLPNVCLHFDIHACIHTYLWFCAHMHMGCKVCLNAWQTLSGFASEKHFRLDACMYTYITTHMATLWRVRVYTYVRVIVRTRAHEVQGAPVKSDRLLQPRVWIPHGLGAGLCTHIHLYTNLCMCMRTRARLILSGLCSWIHHEFGADRYTQMSKLWHIRCVYTLCICVCTWDWLSTASRLNTPRNGCRYVHAYVYTVTYTCVQILCMFVYVSWRPRGWIHHG